MPKDTYWRLFRVAVPFSKQLKGTDFVEWVVYYDGKRHEVASIVRNIDEMWDNIIEQMGLDQNQIPDELKVDAEG